MATNIMDVYNFAMQGEQQGKRNRLSMLLGKAYGQPEQRQDLLGQAAQIDPLASAQMGGVFQKQEDADMQQAAKAAAFLASVPEQSRPQVYQQMLPSLAKIPALQGVLPQQYDEQVAGLVNSFAQTYGVGAQGVPSGYREFDLMAKDAQLSPEDRALAARRQLYLDPRPSNAAIQYKEVEGPDGRKYMVALDPREVGAQTIGGGPAYGSYAGQNGSAISVPPDQQAILNSLPEQDRQAAMMAMQQGGTFAVTPQGAQPAGNPFASRRPEDEEAAKRAAQIQTELAYAPQVADASAAKITKEEEAKLAVDKKAKAPKARMAMMQAKERATRVEDAIDKVLPNVNLFTAGFASVADFVPGTPQHDLAKQLETVKANIGFDELNQMRQSSPTGGALGNVTERELAFLQAVVSNLQNSQSPQQLRENLMIVKRAAKESWQRVEEAYQQDFGEQKRLRFNPATGEFE